MKKILILTVLFIASNLIFAQENLKKCLTTFIVKNELENNPEYSIIRNNLINYQKENIENKSNTQTEITIPVVIHIVHRTQDAIGVNANISNSQIEDGLRVLNEDFSKTNAEFPIPPRNTFLSSAGNPNIKFCLATTDPNGNTTTGVTRTPSSKSGWDADYESNDMKRTSLEGIDSWDPFKYLNIWICNLTNSGGGGQTLGYTYPPGMQNSNNPWKDGLVVDYKHFGTIEEASSSDGRTPTHEVGHYLNLEHTFAEEGWGWGADPCVDSQGNLKCCDNDDDNVNDTPPTNDIYFGSVTSATNNNTCDNDISYGFSTDLLDMDENYMSYAENTWMFSNSQVTAMKSTLEGTWLGNRRSLWNDPTTVNCSGTVATVAVDEFQLANLHVYPNPNLGVLNISLSEKINTISISDIMGKQILFTENFTGNSIDLSSFENGVYFIIISTDKGVHIKNIILNK